MYTNDNRSIVNNRLMASVSQFHRNTQIRLCTVTITINDFNEELEITSLTDVLIKGYMQPSKPDQEVRRADQTIVLEAFDISCDGYYPQLEVDSVLYIGSEFYNVLSVRHDDTHTMTMLVAEIYNPDA